MRQLRLMASRWREWNDLTAYFMFFITLYMVTNHTFQREVFSFIFSPYLCHKKLCSSNEYFLLDKVAKEGIELSFKIEQHIFDKLISVCTLTHGFIF